jgi:hypothetical protein
MKIADKTTSAVSLVKEALDLAKNMKINIFLFL